MNSKWNMFVSYTIDGGFWYKSLFYYISISFIKLVWMSKINHLAYWCLCLKIELKNRINHKSQFWKKKQTVHTNIDRKRVLLENTQGIERHSWCKLKIQMSTLIRSHDYAVRYEIRNYSVTKSLTNTQSLSSVITTTNMGDMTWFQKYLISINSYVTVEEIYAFY